jgi:ABC-type nitrate/sulfonate/bicarbonate transport system substrate-binding protein
MPAGEKTMNDGDLYRRELDQREVQDRLHWGIANLLRWLGFLAFFILFMTACQERSEKSAGTPEKITIAYSVTTGAFLVEIAFIKGYFGEEGLDATPQLHAFGKQALHAVLEGKADLATVADTPIMFAVMNGKRITILGVIQTSNRNTAIVAAEDRGIARASDLKGRNVGVMVGTTSDFFADIFLSAHGIDRNQVTFIDLKPEEMAAALDMGRIDAASTFHPYLAQLQKNLGNKGRTFYGETLYTEHFCLAAGQDYVQNHPEAIRKVLRALIKAETYAQQQPEEARRLVAEFIKMDRAMLEKVVNDLTHRVTLDQALLVDLEDQSRWAMKSGLAGRTHMPNYLDYIYFDGLQTVKPDAVRIIR